MAAKGLSAGKVALVAVLVALVFAFFFFDLGDYLSLSYLKSQQARIQAYANAHPVQSAAIYFAGYVTITALSLPAAAVLTLLGGAIFGLLLGTVLCSFAATAGATIAFLVARFLLRDMVLARFGDNLSALNRGVEKDGAFYLFTLRLVPLFPFFVVNLAMALTPIRAFTYAWVSQVGMLAGTAVYVNAGTQLARIESLDGILSPALIGSFVLLGIFPWVARRALEVIKARRALRKWPKPRRFDWDLVVVGAGSAGLVSSLIGTTLRARVALVERDRMGGDCLNTGCVPSKALIRTTRLLAQIRNAKAYGIRQASAEVDFAEVMERVRRVIRTIEPHDSRERYQGLGVECVEGDAALTSPYTIEVGGRTLTTRNIVIAAGAGPLVPPIPGLDRVAYRTSDTIWDLRTLPESLLVLGGGRDRLRARAVLRPPGQPGHPGGDASAPARARGRGSLRNRCPTFSGGGHRHSGGPHREAGRGGRRWAASPDLRARRERGGAAFRRDPGGAGPPSPRRGLRTRGARDRRGA